MARRPERQMTRLMPGPAMPQRPLEAAGMLLQENKLSQTATDILDGFCLISLKFHRFHTVLSILFALFSNTLLSPSIHLISGTKKLKVQTQRSMAMRTGR